MASYAPLYHSIWTDEDFAGLSPAAKLLYVMLVSHPKLTRCGALDLMPGRWSKATGLTREAVENALEELTADRFVLVDHHSEELVVRSKVKNDHPGTWQQVKSVWKAWSVIESQTLREALTREFPDSCWAFPEGAPPLAHRDTQWDTQGDTDTHSEGDTESHSRGVLLTPNSLPTPTPPDLGTYKGKPNPVEKTVEAAAAIRERNARRANGTACPECNDTWRIDSITEPGATEPCPLCRPPAHDQLEEINP